MLSHQVLLTQLPNHSSISSIPAASTTSNLATCKSRFGTHRFPLTDPTYQCQSNLNALYSMAGPSQQAHQNPDLFQPRPHHIPTLLCRLNHLASSSGTLMPYHVPLFSTGSYHLCSNLKSFIKSSLIIPLSQMFSTASHRPPGKE